LRALAEQADHETPTSASGKTTYWSNRPGAVIHTGRLNNSSRRFAIFRAAPTERLNPPPKAAVSECGKQTRRLSKKRTEGRLADRDYERTVDLEEG